jgi:hypothetical protein
MNDGARSRLAAEVERPSRTRMVLGVVGALGFIAAVATVRQRIFPKKHDVSTGLCGERSSYCERAIEVRSAPHVVVDHPVLRVSPRELRLSLGAKVMHPQGEAAELEQLALEVRLLDENGQRLEAREVMAQADFAPALRPGDTAAFYFGEEVPAATRRVELAVLRRRAVPAPAVYDAATPVELLFDPPAPRHFSLRAGFRSSHKQVLGEMVSHEAVLEVENTGGGVVRSLTLEWRARDAVGMPLGRDDKQTAVYSHMPAMSPGERRLVRMRLWVPNRVATEAVVVTEVR